MQLSERETRCPRAQKAVPLTLPTPHCVSQPQLHQRWTQPGLPPQSPACHLTSSHSKQHQHRLCFSSWNQPYLLMLCHFQSYSRLRRHGKRPASFNIKEKLLGQGSPFPSVPHKAVCDQIRHRAIRVRNTVHMLFPENCNRALPTALLSVESHPGI